MAEHVDPSSSSIEALYQGFSWDRILDGLDWGGRTRLNIAHESCTRWASHRGEIAILYESLNGRRRTLTYSELNLLSNRFANALRHLDVRRGERVATLLPKSPEIFITALAVWKLGAIFVPLFSGFGDDAIRHRITRSDARVVVVGAADQERVERVLDHDARVVLVADRKTEGASFWSLVENADPSFTTVETAPKDTAALLFTSGTTGLPKGCIIPHAGLIGLLPFVEHVMALRADDLLWATADPSWVFGLMSTGMAPMALGYPRLVYDGPFDPPRWWEVAERWQVTHLTGAPTTYRMLASAGADVIRQRRLALTGGTSAGEPLNPEPMRWFQDHLGLQIRDSYGLSEIGFVIANFRSVAHPIRPGSAGLRMPGFEVELLDDGGNPVGIGEPGTIAVRHHPWFLGSGYWEMDRVWQERWRGDWFLTGDVASRDKDGYFWFVGRNDDVIVTSGLNVGPFEVESVLVGHPAIAEAAIVGKPDATRGQIVKAYVILVEGATADDALVRELQDLVRGRVGRHAYPREVAVVGDLPRTISGKIRRTELRQRAIEEAGGVLDGESSTGQGPAAI